jgi:hypothetical protein
MPRPLLRDDKWERMTDVLPGKANDCEITAKNNRLYSDAALYFPSAKRGAKGGVVALC